MDSSAAESSKPMSRSFDFTVSTDEREETDEEREWAEDTDEALEEERARNTRDESSDVTLPLLLMELLLLLRSSCCLPSLAGMPERLPVWPDQPVDADDTDEADEMLWPPLVEATAEGFLSGVRLAVANLLAS